MVENLRPCIDAGRFCVKRVAGDRVDVTADVFADGHDVVAAVLRHRRDGERRFSEVRMQPLGNDRFAASFPVEVLGRHSYSVRAWIDRFATWRDQLGRRVEAGQDVAGRARRRRGAGRGGGRGRPGRRRGDAPEVA